MNETTILVIEDDKSIQNFMKISLKTRGYAYILADNGLSGISLFYADHPDLILLDLGLPDIDGMEVLRQIRQKSDVPIIVVSARGQEREKISALDQGADDYVTKPFSAEELLARIRVGLRHKSSTVNHQEQGHIIAYQSAKHQAPHNGCAQYELVDQAAFHNGYNGIAALFISQLVGLPVYGPHKQGFHYNVANNPHDVACIGNADE